MERRAAAAWERPVASESPGLEPLFRHLCAGPPHQNHTAFLNLRVLIHEMEIIPSKLCDGRRLWKGRPRAGVPSTVGSLMRQGLGKTPDLPPGKRAPIEIRSTPGHQTRNLSCEARLTLRCFWIRRENVSMRVEVRNQKT